MLELLYVRSVNVVKSIVPKRPYKSHISVRFFAPVKLLSAYPFGMAFNGVFSVGTFQKQLRQSLINVVDDKPLIFSR